MFAIECMLYFTLIYFIIRHQWTYYDNIFLKTVLKKNKIINQLSVYRVIFFGAVIPIFFFINVYVGIYEKVVFNIITN